METIDTVVKVYKTKPYTLRAIKKYYEKNKDEISRKTIIGRFIKKANGIIDQMETGNDYIKWILIMQLSSYKHYQTSKDVRLQLKDRLLSVVSTLDTTNNDISILRIAPYGDEDDITYDGNY